MAGLRLKKLVIERFRNVRPGTTLSFSDGMNVLLGKNGTGKSTLLDLVAAVATGNVFPYESEPLEFEATLSDETSSFSYRVVQRVQGEPDLDDLRGAPVIERAATLTLPEHGIEVERRDGKIRVLRAGKEIGSRFDGGWGASALGLLLAVIYSDVRDIPEVARSVARLRTSVVSAANNLYRHDEVLGTLAQMLSGGVSLAERELVLLHRMPTEVGAALKSRVFEHQPYANLDVDAVPFLAKVVAAFEFSGGRLDLRLITSAGQVRVYGEPRFFFTARDGTGFTESALSFGQRRLLSFLYYAACNPDIVVADELVNGLHYEWAKLCLDTISDRQAFLSSQDPLLFDYLTFESVEQVEQSLILCTLDKSEDGKGQFVWRNVPREEAEAFFRSYENGLQHVSEILRAKGLW
jgi:hypothetical protein